MTRRNDPARIQLAKLTGAATAIRDQVTLADPTVVATQREALPRLWEAIDALSELAVEEWAHG